MSLRRVLRPQKVPIDSYLSRMNENSWYTHASFSHDEIFLISLCYRHKQETHIAMRSTNLWEIQCNNQETTFFFFFPNPVVISFIHNQERPYEYIGDIRYIYIYILCMTQRIYIEGSIITYNLSCQWFSYKKIHYLSDTSVAFPDYVWKLIQ